MRSKSNRVERLSRVFAGERWNFSDDRVRGIETRNLEGIFWEMVNLRYNCTLVAFEKAY